MKIVALDIGGTAIKSGLFVDGMLQEKKETPSDALLGGQHIMETAMRIIEGYNGYERIGISTASQVDSDRGVIRYANRNIPNYTGVRVRELLQERFCVPVAVENDVNSAAYGEAVFGAGRDANNGDFLCLTYGTGIGGAIVLGGRIFKGTAFSAGEFGHMITHADVPRKGESWRTQGFYENYASTNALVRMAQEVDPNMDNGKVIFSNLANDNIRAVVDNWIIEIIFGLASLVHIFNPSLIVMGGGIMKEMYIIESIQSHLQEYIMPSYADVQVVAAQLGNEAGLYGISRLASLQQ